MNRRHFFSFTAGISTVAVLAACGVTGGATPSGLDTVISDVASIASGLSGILPIIDNIIGLDPGILDQVKTAIADLQVIAAELKTVNSISGAQPLVQAVESELNTIVTGLASIPMPPSVAIVLQAATILLPIIEAGANLIVSAKVTRQAAKVQLTPDQARHILRDFAQ